MTEKSPVVALSVYILLNVGILVGVYAIRFLWKLYAIETMIYQRFRVFVLIEDALDPHLPNLIWTLTLYLFWSTYWVQNFDALGRGAGYHRISFIPAHWPMQRIRDGDILYFKISNIILLLWAVRVRTN